ncbi:hypothetical protein R6Q57_005277 [Mikania cordata]
MMKWQHERSFEHQNVMPKTGVLLLQTLFFADQKKTEGAITELLVGLNYIWRFDNAKSLLNCSHFKNVQQHTSLANCFLSPFNLFFLDMMLELDSDLEREWVRRIQNKQTNVHG